MHKRVKKKKIRIHSYIGIMILIIIVSFFVFKKDEYNFIGSDNIEQIKIVDDGHVSYLENIQAKTVADVIEKYGTGVLDNDRIFPQKNSRIFTGDVVNIVRNKKLTVKVDGEEKSLNTFGDSIENLLDKNDIDLAENDILVPHGNLIIDKDTDVEITRVEFKEEVKTEKIPFKTILKKDDDVNFLKKYVDQKGEDGKKETIYKIAYHNGEEVDRELLEEKITKEAIDEITIEGTKVKLGKKHTGACSWYAHTGTMAAANPWLPKGSYVKVTNKANGKSVIVKINDRGPFVPGRIIDLDKVAFAKIASIGAGVIDVKMEEIVN